MRHKILTGLLVLALTILACTSGTPGIVPTLKTSPYDLGRTVYGFFPSPPEASTQSILETYQEIARHGEVALLQPAIPWADFAQGAEVESKAINDIHGQYVLAHQNGLEVIFVVDPLDGMNRSKFQGLPAGWEASFADPMVRTAFTNYALRIVKEFHPRYLGLASEINTYQDAHPEDFPNYLSLYNEVYELVKAEAPATQIFVTFQWEELNNLITWVAHGVPYQINWNQIEQFEPNLDLWAISSYPFVIFKSGAEIPADYYTPLLSQTSKPLAVAEGGYSSEPVGPFSGDPRSQADYLNAIHSQIGGDRLVFWIYLILSDFSMESYATVMSQTGQVEDINNLGMFASVGLTTFDRTPKPALAIWDAFRQTPQQ